MEIAIGSPVLVASAAGGAVRYGYHVLRWAVAALLLTAAALKTHAVIEAVKHTGIIDLPQAISLLIALGEAVVAFWAVLHVASVGGVSVNNQCRTGKQKVQRGNEYKCTKQSYEAKQQCDKNGAVATVTWVQFGGCNLKTILDADEDPCAKPQDVADDPATPDVNEGPTTQPSATLDDC